jgi:hypothetical protein
MWQEVALGKVLESSASHPLILCPIMSLWKNPRPSCQMLVADKRHCLAFLEPLIEGNVLVDFGFLCPTVLSNRGLYTSDSDETLL